MKSSLFRNNKVSSVYDTQAVRAKSARRARHSFPTLIRPRKRGFADDVIGPRSKDTRSLRPLPALGRLVVRPEKKHGDFPV